MNKSPILRRITYNKPLEKTGFPYEIPLFSNGFELEFTHPITIICGENGSGKSTLLEIIADGCGFNLEGGNGSHIYESRNDLAGVAHNFKFSWLPKTSKGFFFRAESFFNYATYLEEIAKYAGEQLTYRPYGGKPLHHQSHGESFLALFNNRIAGRGVYIFDEPESALSPIRQIAFLSILKRILSAGESQVIIATHSPILMSYPNSQFLMIEEGKLENKKYTDSQHYKVTRRFLENPDFYLKEIFDCVD